MSTEHLTLMINRRHKPVISYRALYDRRLFGTLRNSSSCGLFRQFSNSASQGATPYKLSDIGEGITEVEVLQWYIKVGDTIKSFDRICEVQSDKATVEISSRYDGTVTKIYHQVGAMAKVGQPLIDILQHDGNNAVQVKGNLDEAPRIYDQSIGKENSSIVNAAELGERAKAAQAINPKPLAVPSSPKVESHFVCILHGEKRSGLVRAIAKENSVDLSLVRGTGRDGRIMKEDLLAYIASTSLPNSAPAMLASSQPPPTREAAAQPSHPKATWVGEDRVEPVRGYMRTMIKTMQAQVEIPHMGYCDDYDVDGMLRVREAIKAAAQAKGVRLTYMPLIIKAVSLALSEFPEVNAALTADRAAVVYKAAHNIGVAVDTPAGLVVPNIKAVQALSVLDVAAELARLADLAKTQRLPPQDLVGGTLTISNIGAVGGTYMSPILMPGEAVLCALGSVRREARVDQAGRMVPVTVMRVSYAADHRILAGATIARFSNAVKAYLADPATMLLHLR